MKILAIECSASPVSVAVIEDGKIISSAFSNIKVTHSETLMPMVESVLLSAKSTLGEIGGFAVSNGPGSFTGIRIGISAVKGMAAPENKPCAAVSTLYAMASRFTASNGIISPVMDARCGQVYNALFRAENGKITRITYDRALMCEELSAELKNYNENITVCGDGSDVFKPFTKGLSSVIFPGAELKFQHANGVAIAASDMFKNGETLSPAELLPVYLRLPQAERELKSKQKKD